MYKITIKYLLLTAIFLTQLSLNVFAMEVNLQERHGYTTISPTSQAIIADGNIEDGNYIISCKTKNRGTKYLRAEWYYVPPGGTEHGGSTPAFYYYMLFPGNQKQEWSIRNNKGYYEVFSSALRHHSRVCYLHGHIFQPLTPCSCCPSCCEDPPGPALCQVMLCQGEGTQENQWSINPTDEGAYTISLKTKFGGIRYLEAHPRLGSILMERQKFGLKAQDQKWYLERRSVGILPIIQEKLPGLEQQQMVSRPMSIPIPEIARGYEEIYRLFYNGKLVYKPDPNSDTGRIDLPIASLASPLEGTFDLSRCGDIGSYLSIHTGYKKGKIAANKDKVEIWFVPRFMVEEDLKKSGIFTSSPAKHLQPIMGTWSVGVAPIGIIWTWGNDDLKYYDYLTTQPPENLSDNNLYEKWKEQDPPLPVRWVGGCRRRIGGDIGPTAETARFHVHFMVSHEAL